VISDPSTPPLAEALADGRYEMVHVCTTGPAGLFASSAAKARGRPVVASHHAVSRDPAAISRDTTLFGQADVVLSPTAAADRSLAILGVPRDRISRWEPGVDRTRFSPACYGSDILPDAFNVLFVGPLDPEHGTDLLTDAFLLAHDRDPRLHLVLAGVGPAEARLRTYLQGDATFLGAVEDEPLARVYASADLLVFVDATDTFGQAVLDAQASGLPVLAREDCSAAELIENGRGGCLVAPDPNALGGAIRGLARRATLQDRLATGGLVAARERTPERSAGQLASGYAHAIASQTGTTSEVARAA
jgi:glycosyltransferase involved in cell wall biosynthesis